MPKKKVVVSGFSILMKELQEKLAIEGRKVPMGQMKDIADPVWKGMSVEERYRYNQRAKQKKGQMRMTMDKLASDGTSIKENFELEEEEVQRERQVLLDLKEYINANADPEAFRAYASRRTIFIVSFNILCCTDDNIYIPLEVSITEYTVQRGIIRNYHKFINPGVTPSGYAGEAMRHREDTHKIPATGVTNSESDYGLIWREIRQFLCPLDEDELPPMFCLNDGIEQAVGCFQWITDRVDSDYFPMIKIWDLGHLLNEMRSSAGSPLPSVLIATELLLKNTFDYTLGTRCNFHEDLDSPYCALGVCRRLCYLMSDCLCGVFDVEVTDKHLPTRAIEEKCYEIHHPNISKSKDFLESQLPQQIHENVATASRSHGIDSIDTFSDEDETLSVQSYSDASVYSFKQPAQVPVREMAQLRINNPVKALGHGIGRGRARNA